MNIHHVYKQNEKFAIYEVGASTPIMANPNTPAYSEAEAWLAQNPGREGGLNNPWISPEVRATREAKIKAKSDEAESLALDMAYLHYLRINDKSWKGA